MNSLLDPNLGTKMRLAAERRFLLAAAGIRPGERIKAPGSTSEPSQQQLAAKIAGFIKNHDLHKASSQLLAKGALSCTEEVMLKLEALHPTEAVPKVEQEQTVAFSGIEIEGAHVQEAVQSISSRSAAGPDGMTPGHLKTCMKDDKFARLFVQLTQLCVDGKLPRGSTLCNATLIALPKDSGGVRPIAITSVVMRAMQKAIMRTDGIRRIMAELAPLQLGVGQSAGKDAVIHATRQWLADSGPTDRLALQLDISNAFNTLKRSYLLKAIEGKDEWKCLLPVTRWLFSSHADLWMRTGSGLKSISSQSGVKQGEPLSPLLFAMGIHKALEVTNDHICTQGPENGGVRGYLDDTTLLVRNMEQAATGFTVFKEEAEHAGLQVNGAKSVLMSTSALQTETTGPIEQAPALPPVLESTGVRVAADGIMLLGAPVGSQQYMKAQVETSIASLINWVDKLDSLDDLDRQSRLILLRQCGLSRVTHLPQVCPPQVVTAAMGKAHDRIAASIAKMTDHTHPLPAPALHLISQPIRLGGMGVTKFTAAHCAAAYVGSACKARRLLLQSSRSLDSGTRHQW